MESERRSWNLLRIIRFSGWMDTSIAIRTATIDGKRPVFQAVSSITALSNPEAEYEETLRFGCVVGADRRCKPLYGCIGAGIAVSRSSRVSRTALKSGKAAMRSRGYSRYNASWPSRPACRAPQAGGSRPRAMYLRIVFGSRPVRRVIALIDKP